MKRRPLLPAAIAAIAVLVAVWYWRSRPAEAAVRPVSPRAAKPVQPRPPATAALPEFREVRGESDFELLVAALARLLARDDVRPGETVLTFNDADALTRFLARAGKAGLDVIGRLDALNSVRVRFADLASLARELSANGADYADVSANYLYNIPGVPPKESRAALNQAPFGNTMLAFVGATGDRGTWGRGVTIAVLDTGVAADATFGAGRLAAIDLGHGLGPGAGPDDGHGTSVASLAAGNAPDAAGLAPAAGILSIRVTDAGGGSDVFTVAQAIVAAVDAGAQVVNISMGGYGTNNALRSAITYAEQRGAVIVAAAGNDQASQLTWPAADPRVISVGAVDRAEQQVAFSNSGPQLQLSAPGYHVQTAWSNGSRVLVDGTSASAPIVAGAIAALMSQNPSLNAAQAAELLRHTANDAGAPGADSAYGRGILNVGWAMNVGNPAYVDTAVSSHFYDSSRRQMAIVVQNRSGRTVSGLSLSVLAAGTTSNVVVPTLNAGETEVVRVPVDANRATTSTLQFVTTLANAPGVVDQVPANNRRSSSLTLGPRR